MSLEDIMSTVLFIRDESATGKEIHRFRLKVPALPLTAEELLRQRVSEEALRFNRERPVCYQSLVTPTGAEETAQGFRLSQHRDVDQDAQVAAALEAFTKGLLSLYVGNRLVTDIHEKLTLESLDEVSFVRLGTIVAG